ncbi:Serine acetyltransferase [Serratia marcescens]|uniref:serine O-acetyltransferase n=1 Tax=Serratia TaxID=613 RepID=UPI000744F92B|nr:serine O-acetyltransferase [Serratia marcescens]CVG84588.1 Serine acetyltransferase [Serratia marcescens]
MRLMNYAIFPNLTFSDPFWVQLRQEATALAEREGVMSKLLQQGVLQHATFNEALANRLALKLANDDIDATSLRNVVEQTLQRAPDIVDAALADMRAVYERDPACHSTIQIFFFFKGFIALQAYRVSHALYQHQHREMAYHIQSRVSELFCIDIHPAAKLGKGIMLDHAHAIVIGETATVGDNVSLLHSVTLGGTGKAGGDRHPKVGNGAVIGAGAKILGNVRIGDSCCVAAGAVVLKDIPPSATAVGIPARIVGL